MGRNARRERAPEQPLPAHEEHGADDDDGERVLDLDGQGGAREALGDAEDQRADDGAGEAVEPAEDGGGEPLMKGSSMNKGSRRRAGARKIPATTPSAEATPQEMLSTTRVGMPSVCAAFAFSEVARIARPSRVFGTRRQRSL